MSRAPNDEDQQPPHPTKRCEASTHQRGCLLHALLASISRPKRTLQQVPKLFDRQPCVTNDPAHRKSVNGVVARNG